MNPQLTWSAFLTSFLSSTPQTDIWSQALRQLTVVKLENGVAFLQCSSVGVRTVALNKQVELSSLLNKAFQMPILGVHCEVVSTEKKSEKKNTSLASSSLFGYEPTLQDVLIQSGLNPKHTFENYAVSHCNNVAYAAAQVVVEQIGQAYNPLFLWGGVGVGKTHLAQATAHRILQLNTSRRVFFCAGDKFTNEIIEAIRTRSTEKFRAKYRRLDVLIVDDVQFIAGKDAIQQEFFNTFNEIVGRGGQVILIADRPPHLIQNIDDRLRSRFIGGLTIDISPPDFELKTAILMIKANDRGITIDIEAAKKIAESSDDGRMLEGTLMSSYARIISDHKNENVHDIILRKEDVTFPGEVQQIRQRVLPDQVLQTVCLYFQLKPLHIRQQNRAEKISRARHILMYILREHLEMNLDEIARFLKRKDHTTIIHGVQKIRERVMHDTHLATEIESISRNLGLSTS